MCWSLEASLGAFLWCSTVAVYLHQRRATPRDLWASKFLGAYGLVQLCDAAFWWNRDLLPQHDPSPSKGPHSVCDATNQFVSEIGLPMVLTLGVAVQIHQGIENWFGKSLPKWTLALFGIWILSAPRRFDLYWGPRPYCTSILDHRTLLWGDRPADRGLGKYWVYGGTLSFSLPFVAMRPTRVGVLYFSLGVISSLVAYNQEPLAWGSNWCFIAALFSLVFIAEPHVTGAFRKAHLE